MNRPSKNLCEQVCERLVAGGSLSDQPELATHAGSCLKCFRMAGDLRDVPRIKRVLLQSRPAADIDPGEAFWTKFPDRVVNAWERTRLADVARNGNPVRARVLEALRAWFRLPVPAAAAGAVLAGIVVFALVRRDPGERGELVRPAPDVARPEVVASGAAADISAPEISDNALVGPMSMYGDDEAVEYGQHLGSLEVADLNMLLTAMENEQHASSTWPRPQEAEESEPAVGVADEVETLGTDELKDLDQALRRSSHI